MMGFERLSGLRILLVDDDPAVRRLLHRLLAGEGALVCEASDGRDAVAQVSGGARFHVALLDLEMPDMRGADVARALRAAPGALRVGVLIGMSGGAPPTRAEPPLFDAFLSKPLSRARLVSAICSCGKHLEAP